MRDARATLLASLSSLRSNVTNAGSRELLNGIESGEATHQVALDSVIALRRTDADANQVAAGFEATVTSHRENVRARLASFVQGEERLLEAARAEASTAAQSSSTFVLVLGGSAILLGLTIAIVLTRSVGLQIGTAIGQMQSSSTQLHAAATQQATGAREQATAMNEVTTTIRELLATSRQIAESSQRVAKIAEDTANAAQGGEGAVVRAQDALLGIRRQVDLVVGHMTDLGRKSHQIGAVLDIVSELAEQTNILAINATIEAAGAGEAGRRFNVVADEIRKLSDRVTGSAKEIRGLVDDVLTAVNATVMVTESGSKAVDIGSRQFTDLSSSFTRIANMVATTTDAAREIELSTKQQSTAVEQVNIAISNVAQATREAEASSSETLQTATELAGLSRTLLQLVRPRAAA
jgi:methyl-accepting chemotaxis protein